MFSSRQSPSQFRRINLNQRPRGVAVVMVLGLLAITLAISYATLRGQGITSQLARNNTRALDARVAAQSGLAAALRKISQNSWAGVNVPLSSNVTNQSWYQVTFSTGDAKLTSTDPQYNEYPFRLTIDAVGYAADPLNPAVRSQHKSRCVVQLLRKRMVAAPANWTAVSACTLHQYSNKDALVQFPVQISGPTCLLGRLVFCSEYPVNVAARDQYLADLNARRLVGLGDERPFPGTMVLRGVATTQDATTMSLLTTKLGMVLIDTSASQAEPVSHPGTVLNYRLYPGGKQYTPPIVQNTYGNPIQNVTLNPDPIANPLGIYRSNGGLSIQNNVIINGTLIADGGGAEVQVHGTNVRFNAVNMPGLYGSSDVYQLPAAIAVDDLRLNSGAGLEINGMALVWDEMEIKSGLPSTQFKLRGNLIANTIKLRGRSTWAQTDLIWGNDKADFSTQLLNLLNPNRSLFFPDYMEKVKSFVVKPTLTLSPDSSGVKPHWHDWSQAVYQRDPADPGLRWEVVRWEDNL